MTFVMEVFKKLMKGMRAAGIVQWEKALVKTDLESILGINKLRE